MLDKIKNSFRNFWKEEDGVGVVELILIIVVLIAMVLIFKERLKNVINTIFDTIETRMGEV